MFFPGGKTVCAARRFTPFFIPVHSSPFTIISSLSPAAAVPGGRGRVRLSRQFFVFPPLHNFALVHDQELIRVFNRP
jgi:hypothetical protein